LRMKDKARAAEARSDAQKGYSSVELIFTVLLLFLLGTAAVSLLAAGSQCFARIIDRRDGNAGLRTALCLLDKAVRRHDVQGAITLREYEDGRMLVMKEPEHAGRYETRYYVHEGMLYEALVPAGTPDDPEYGFAMTALDGFSVEIQENGTLGLSVWITRDGKRQTLSSAVACRSAALTSGEDLTGG